MKFVALLMSLLVENNTVSAFAPTSRVAFVRTTSLNAATSTATAGGFIETELRGAAMKLHTRSQAPKEGKAEEKVREPYTPTRADYLAFLVDSKHVYEAMEEIVNSKEELAVFRNTGLERTEGLEKDIQFMVEEYGLERPEVAEYGKSYAEQLRTMAERDAIPEFMCHYYNFYFAHTAGGRMIGKQMSALLLDRKTLEFYKWDGDLNEIKGRVKNSIEEMAAAWTQEQRDECVAATAGAFRFGGAINAHLSGGQSAH